MTNVRRPFHLQLRSPTSTPTPAGIGSPKALSPTAADSLPSQILPHLFVGNQEQTNRETVNRLSISYILSLGLLPLISCTVSPTSPTASTTTTSSNMKHKHNTTYTTTTTKQQQQQPHQLISMPSRNSSKDFKIRVRTNAVANHPPPPQTPNGCNTPTLVCSATATTTTTTTTTTTANLRDENKGVKQVRWVQCKCINIADSSEQILSKFFDEAHQFIDEARRRKCNILVHCQAGISRSPTIAIAYLMRVNSLPLQDAYNLVKQCRPQTDPNLSFMGQLMLYEKSLEEESPSASASSSSSRQRKQVAQDT